MLIALQKREECAALTTVIQTQAYEMGISDKSNYLQLKYNNDVYDNWVTLHPCR